MVRPSEKGRTYRDEEGVRETKGGGPGVIDLLEIHESQWT